MKEFCFGVLLTLLAVFWLPSFKKTEPPPQAPPIVAVVAEQCDPSCPCGCQNGAPCICKVPRQAPEVVLVADAEELPASPATARPPYDAPTGYEWTNREEGWCLKDGEGYVWLWNANASEWSVVQSPRRAVTWQCGPNGCTPTFAAVGGDCSAGSCASGNCGGGGRAGIFRGRRGGGRCR